MRQVESALCFSSTHAVAMDPREEHEHDKTALEREIDGLSMEQMRDMLIQAKRETAETKRALSGE